MNHLPTLHNNFKLLVGPTTFDRKILGDVSNAQIDYIRHEVSQTGETYASVARRIGVDSRTVSKYANQETFEKKKKKYHSTAKKIHKQLKDLHDFTV